MTTMTQADFARAHGVSRSAVTQWKERGFIVLSGDLIDVEASDKLLKNRRQGRFNARKPTGQRRELNEPARKAVIQPDVRVRIASVFVDGQLCDTVELDSSDVGVVAVPVNGSGVHPLALQMSVDGDVAALVAAELLLPHLPEDRVRAIVAEMHAQLTRGSVELLEIEGIPPPEGLHCWAEYPGFTDPPFPEFEWEEMLQELADTQTPA